MPAQSAAAVPQDGLMATTVTEGEPRESRTSSATSMRWQGKLATFAECQLNGFAKLPCGRARLDRIRLPAGKVVGPTSRSPSNCRVSVWPGRPSTGVMSLSYPSGSISVGVSLFECGMVSIVRGGVLIDLAPRDHGGGRHQLCPSTIFIDKSFKGFGPRFIGASLV